MAYRYKADGQVDPANPEYGQINEQYILREASEVDSTCIPITDINGDLDETKDINDQYITKHGYKCNNKFTFTFPNDGTATDSNGWASENYEFSFYSVDLAGNLSTLTPNGDNVPNHAGVAINDVSRTNIKPDLL